MSLLKLAITALLLPATFLALKTQHPPSSALVQTIEDQSQLPLLSKELDTQKSRKLRFANGLEVLLISDEKANQSAACMAVEVGSWNDPESFPGMAHFCEHMLFMGTEKYPNTNAFFTSLSDHKGITNAYTAPEKTLYMFSSETEGFLELLDMFAHFFQKPLFSTENIAKEMHAVDHEFAQSKEHDGWRFMMVLKETGNPEHPNNLFSCGNSKTLSNIPQKALIDWHKKHYGAEKMHLVLYSPLPLEKLQEEVLASFKDLPQSLSPSKIDPSIPLLSSKQKGQITYIEPIRNQQSLTLLWELPYHLATSKAKVAKILSYAVEKGQPHSLYELLKKEHLIDSISVQEEHLGSKEHAFFSIEVALTDKGLKELDTTLLRIYQNLAFLRKTGIPYYLFQEKNNLAQTRYQYQHRKEAFSYVMQQASDLLQESLESYPKNHLLISEFDAKQVQELLQLLTPDTCAYFLSAPKEKTGITYDAEERWMQVPYTHRPIPSHWVNLYTYPEPNPDLYLAKPNPFVSSQFHLAPLTEIKPQLLSENEFGSAYYARCPEYSSPEATIHLEILSQENKGTAKDQVLLHLLADHWTDEIGPLLLSASQAGYLIQFSTEKGTLQVHIHGFSDKLPLVLQKLIQEIPIKEPSPEQFALYKDRWEKFFSNQEKELGYKQSSELMMATLFKGQFTSQEKHAALKSLNYEDFLTSHQSFLDRIYLKALFAGNLSLKEAQGCWLDLLHTLPKAPFLKEEHPISYGINLAEGPFSIFLPTEIQGHATTLLIDLGAFSFETKAMQEIYLPVLKEAFFRELRTKQKTGYLAASPAFEKAGGLYQLFIVQSNSHEPTALLHRFELFLEEFLDALPETISASRFELLKKSALSSLEARHYNLEEKSFLWNLLAFHYKADFTWVEKQKQAIEELTYERFLEQMPPLLSKKNKKRVAVLAEGKIPASFAYEVTTPKELQEQSRFVLREEKISLPKESY